MGKDESKSPPPSEKRRVTPSISKKRKRSQEELIDRPQRRPRRANQNAVSLFIFLQQQLHRQASGTWPEFRQQVD
jgi:hypothetical protein